MSFEAAVIISVAVLVATLAGVIILVSSRQIAARNEELRAEASARGWRFEVARDGRGRLYQWRGSTNGLAWVAESIERAGGKNRRPFRVSRWRTEAIKGPESAVLLMGVPPGQEAPARLMEGEGWVARLAQKAGGLLLDQSLDTHFGDDIGREVDAAALKPVPGADLPGFIVMAGDVDLANRLLFRGWALALRTGIADQASPLADQQRRPWVLLWPGGLATARMASFRTTDEVERLATLGAALARLPMA